MRRAMRLKRTKYIAVLFLWVVAFLLPPFNVAVAQEVSTGAAAHVLMEATTFRVLSQKNPHTKLPMASTTKIMTCLLAIEHGDLNEVVTVPEEGAGVEGSSMYLVQGEKLPLNDLVYGLMISSGNDAAVTIAIHIAGSVEEFATLMNERAQSMGALNTHFVTPNGLHDEAHYTTAYDLALISAHALANPIFAEIVSTQSKHIPSDEDSNDHYLTNKNKILYEYDGGNGIKTGYTSVAGKCLAASAYRDGMQLVAVVLNDANMFNDCMSLLDMGFSTYSMVNVATPGQSYARVPVTNGTQSYVNTTSYKEINLPLSQNEVNIVVENVKLEQVLSAPVKVGQLAGYAEYTLDGELLAQRGIYTAGGAEQNDYGYNLGRVLAGYLGGG